MDRKTVLDKIAKLAALADDQQGTPEGKAAEQMVLKLAHKYRIETSEINKDEAFVRHDIKTGKKRRNANESQLYLAICEYCGVLLTLGWYSDIDWFRRYSLYGYENDIDDVRYLFNVIWAQITTKSNQWYEEKRKDYVVHKSHKNSYERGLVIGVSKRLSQLLKGIFEYNGEKGLVPLTEPAQQIEKIKKATDKENLRKTKDSGSISHAALSMGVEDSKDISIHRPLDHNTENSGLQIPMAKSA